MANSTSDDVWEMADKRYRKMRAWLRATYLVLIPAICAWVILAPRPPPDSYWSSLLPTVRIGWAVMLFLVLPIAALAFEKLVRLGYSEQLDDSYIEMPFLTTFNRLATLICLLRRWLLL
jgi:hypothetical protein